jgi:hypothetical protein
MSLVQNQNQFAQTALLGQVTMAPSPAVIPVKIYIGSVATKLQAGQAVKLVNQAGPEIQVDQIDDATTPAFGVIIYNPRKNTYAAGDTVEIALAGTVVYLETSAAIARGAKVQMDPTGPTVSTLTGLPTNASLGVCLDKPTATGQLARILLNPLDPNLSAY